MNRLLNYWRSLESGEKGMIIGTTVGLIGSTGVIVKENHNNNMSLFDKSCIMTIGTLVSGGSFALLGSFHPASTVLIGVGGSLIAVETLYSNRRRVKEFEKYKYKPEDSIAYEINENS